MSDILYHISRIHALSQVFWNCCTPSACPIVFLCVTILHTVVMTQPSHSALSEQRVHTGRLAHYMESALDIFSCHDLPRIRRMLLRWFLELLSILSCLAYVVYISLLYSSVLALQTPIVCLHRQLESLDEHDRLALLAKPKYVNWHVYNVP